MKIWLGVNALGDGMVRLAVSVTPMPSMDVLVDGKPTEQIKVGSAVGILENEALGKHTYQLEDQETGALSNKVTVTVK